MKPVRYITWLCALAGLALSAANTQAATSNDLPRCVDTTYSSSGMGSCGGDNLNSGVIKVNSSGSVAVTVRGALADPYSLYEVYWLSIGEPATSAHLVGNFVTDCNGDSVKSSGTPGPATLKTISKASEINSTAYTNIFTAVGNISAGVFLLYNRGPFSYDPTSAPPCKPSALSEYNTTNSPNDSGATKTTTPFANPAVSLGTDSVQFLSGYHN
jgi:hypothetical protein